LSRRTAATTVNRSESSASERATRPDARRLGFTPREHLAALAIFAAVTVAFFFPLLQGDTFSDVDRRQRQVYPWAAFQEDRRAPLHFDHDDSFHPWQVFTSRELRDGEIPLWNPYSFAGHPFLANGQNGTLYPPRLAFAYLVSPARVHDFLLATHFFFAGVAMFLLLGLLRRSFPAALLGGIAWMTNSFALSWQALDHYVVIEVWLPVGVLLAHLAVGRRSWPAALGLALVGGLLFLGGNVLFVELALVAIYGYGLALVLSTLRRERSAFAGGLARLATAAVLSVGLAAVVILPTLALSGDSSRVSLTFDELEEFALDWSSLVHVFTPPPDPFANDPYHQNLFAGTAVAVLALVGLFRRNVAAVFAAALGVLVVLFMTHTPVTFVVAHVLPGFDNFKPLSRAAFLLVFALVVLAAFGLDRVLGWLASPRGVALQRRLPAWAAGRPLRVALVALLAGSVLFQAERWSGLVMLHQPHRAELLYPETPLIRYLQQQPEGRFLQTQMSFRGSTSMVHRLPSASGYESLLPRRTQTFWRVVGEGLRLRELETEPLRFAYHPELELTELRPGLLARAGVAHVVTPPPDPQLNWYRLPDGEVVFREPGYFNPENPYDTGRRRERNSELYERFGRFDPAWEGDPSSFPPEGLRLRYDEGDGRVFSVAEAVPRAYVVGGCVAVDEPLAALERFVSAGTSSRRVILERPFLVRAGLDCAGADAGQPRAAEVVEESTDSLVVEADAAGDAWLVVNDSWDDDWRVAVDGRDAELVPANYAFRAVRIPAGTHTVRFTYEPTTFRFGAILSLASLATLAGGFVVLAWRRQARRRVSSR
jgi:hypothetical protein